MPKKVGAIKSFNISILQPKYFDYKYSKCQKTLNSGHNLTLIPYPATQYLLPSLLKPQL